ncbi:WcaI family glycosyltransferase [Zobellia galactanivorans]|uniref:WcaI family glycosyltransferase n=1 Tax=Zobellia galactanivorans (strain DSM 12802 / CCUG 47099 / CIP 106680 / NCIMB 13871 / Dsij) TaxID=63186 RepID=UPI001C064A0D|nr:WcaI family glycosyltransferase [Zobellia galactanivorans]MBU3028342.1 WcaI family glycosyltransferase [Zobellia galactanivorans]
MKKRILYIGYNFSPELTGIGKYSGEMMEWLAQAGHDCSVITSYPYYPQWEVQEPYTKKRFGFLKETTDYPSGGRLRVYRCPMYVPKQPSGLKRILSDFSFFASALLLLVVFFFKKKHTYVITVAPTFLSGVLGAFYKKVKRAKHLHHIQDLQIEAAAELGMIKSATLIKLLFRVENFVFKNSQNISSISDAMIERIGKKTKRTVAFLPNWSDTDFFYPIPDNRDLKVKFGFAPEDTTVLYSGGIGEKQGLENILYAAQTLLDRPKVKIIICGSGPYKEVLKSKAQEMQLQNVHFMPLQPKADFNDFLNMADVHLVIQKKNASDLVMPSKLTTILAVGGAALVTANEGTDLYRIVSKYKMGHLIEAENREALTNGIVHLTQSESLFTIKENAHNYAKEYLNINTIMQYLDKKLL